ncbi:MAG: hypothetical protein RL738_349 [Bacteroidota bacterium]|jgi:hypothetical protein
MRFLIPFFALAAALPLAGQHSQDLSISWGGIGFRGDVGPTWAAPTQGQAVTLGYRFQGHPHYALRVVAEQGEFQVSDLGSGRADREARGTTVRTQTQSAWALAEVTFLPVRIPSFRFQHTPYLFSGLGVTAYNPQGQYQGEWMDLRPLGTEGQGLSGSGTTTYGTRALSVPLGLGWRAHLGPWLMAQAEVQWTWVRSDYLDDVSGNYADVEALREARGDAAAYFADPTQRGLTGYARGQSDQNDGWLRANIGLGLHLEKFWETCAAFLN